MKNATVVTFAALLSALSGAVPLGAQARPFLFTITPETRPDQSRSVVHLDVGYGQRLFPGIGQQGLEQRFGAQLGLGRRLTLVAQTGLTFADHDGAGRSSAQAELLVNLLPTTARGTLAIGVGGMRDYTGAGVALARVVAGRRGAQWDVAGNLRLERPFVASGDPSARRDEIDVITTAGVARRVSGAVRVGVETVAEDLEGLFERGEAEGGARVMLGPTITLAPSQSRWQLLVGGGPVVWLTHSLRDGTSSGAPRDLTTRSGYVIRTAIAYNW
jgi:opacity protein-like surface antigen